MENKIWLVITSFQIFIRKVQINHINENWRLVTASPTCLEKEYTHNIIRILQKVKEVITKKFQDVVEDPSRTLMLKSSGLSVEP